MNFLDKNGKEQKSEIVVTVSNWHFNRNSLKEPIAPICKLENVMVTLKLSSTLFDVSNILSSSGRPPLAVQADEIEICASDSYEAGSEGNSNKGTVSSEGDIFFFDKNGVIIPYPVFVDLLNDPTFELYLEKVKEKFSSSSSGAPRAPKPTPSPNESAEDDQELERKRKQKMMMQSRRKRLQLLFGSDDENEDQDQDQDANIQTTESDLQPTLEMDGNNGGGVSGGVSGVTENIFIDETTALSGRGKKRGVKK